MHRIREKLLKIKIGSVGKRGALLLLCIVMLTSLLPVPAQAAYEKYNDAIPSTAIGGGSKLDPGSTLIHKDNAFVMRVLFGSYINDLIQYYRITYMDTDGYTRFQTIFPNYKDLHSRELYLAAQNNTGWFGTHVGYWSYNFWDAATYGIDRTVEFYFEPDYKLNKILSIDIFCGKSSTSTNEAAISEIRIFRVEELYGIGMVGGISDEYFTRFLGECMVCAEFTKRLSWTSDDTVFQLSFKKDENYLVEVNKPYDSFNAAELIFELTFSDIYGAGVEADALPNGKMATSLKDGLFPESLALSIQYTDVNGKKRKTHIPVAMSTLRCAQSNTSISASGVKTVTDNASILDQKVHGILQQGETAVFSAYLPDLATIDKATLVVGSEQVLKLNELCQTAADKTVHETRLKQEVDGISFSSIKIYDGSRASVTSSVQDYRLISKVNGDPIYFSGATNYLGTAILDKSSYTLPLTKYTGSERLNVPGKVYSYLFSFVTDTPEAAGTKDEIFCEVHYVALDGSSKSYGPVSVKNASKDYFGYWPGSDGDVSYTAGAGSGGTICLPISVTDVDYFTGVTLSLAATATDDWQVKEIKIEEIRSLAVRSVSTDKIKVGTKTISDRTYYRNNTSRDISPTLGEPVLIQPKYDKKISFEAGGSASTESSDIDWRENQYSMSYEDASEYLGFEKVRECYEVTVNVASDINSDIENETCGSNNYFYFQLIFEQGVSAYVLANQQLPSDGFLAGKPAKFRIYTNQNYGEVTAVRVIPDTLSEKTDAFDKLKVDSISVSRTDDEGLSATWVAELGEGVWIDIDYHDEAERTSVYGQETRSESELAQTFAITKKGYNLRALFAVTTEGFNNNRFSGQVTYCVKYETTDGSVKTTETSSMVAAICSYANRATKPKTYTIGGQSVNGEEIDFNLMFRANKTDRFTVDLEDVARIDSITINVKNENEGAWLIANVAVYQITSPGVLAINSDNEYQKTSKVKLITTTTSDSSYQLDYKSDGNGGMTISFPENEIEIDMGDGTWTSTISNIPKSQDDTMNIYAYLEYSTHNPSTYRMICSTEYKVITASGVDENGEEYTVADGIFSTSCDMTGDNEKQMFYALGVKASGLNLINKMSFKVHSLNPESACVSHVIVEHVRSGVIINTYYLDFNGQDAEYSCSAVPSIQGNGETPEQVVTFKFTDDSAISSIAENKSDIALCLNYTSENDPTGRVYSSPYIFLSEQGYTSLDYGEIASVTFSQPYVKDITGITFAAVGGASKRITLECAMVDTNVIKKETVAGDTSGEKQDVRYNLNNYSFSVAKTEPVTLAPMTMILSGSTSGTSSVSGNQSQRNAAILRFSFKTADAGSTYETGTSGPISMTVVYDHGAVTYTKEYENIQDITVSGNYAAGQTAVVDIMLPAYDSIRWVELTPYAKDGAPGIVSWKLESLNVGVNTRGDTSSVIRSGLNKTAYSDTPLKIGLASIVIDAGVYSLNEYGKIVSSRHFRSSDEADKKEPEVIPISVSQKIELEPTISGSIDDITVSCKKVSTTSDGKTVKEDASKLISASAQYGVLQSVIFSPGDAAGDYQVIFTSKENEKMNLIISINVKEPEDNAEEEPAEETTDDKTSEEEPPDEKTPGENASNEEKSSGENQPETP